MIIFQERKYGVNNKNEKKAKSNILKLKHLVEELITIVIKKKFKRF